MPDLTNRYCPHFPGPISSSPHSWPGQCEFVNPIGQKFRHQAWRRCYNRMFAGAFRFFGLFLLCWPRALCQFPPHRSPAAGCLKLSRIEMCLRALGMPSIWPCVLFLPIYDMTLCGPRSVVTIRVKGQNTWWCFWGLSAWIRPVYQCLSSITYHASLKERFLCLWVHLQPLQ